MTDKRLGSTLDEVLAKHGPKNDAGAGAPPAVCGDPAGEAMSTPAPASFAVLAWLNHEAITRVLFGHYYDVTWSKDHQGFRCVCHWIGEDHAGHVADELIAAAKAGVS